MPIAAPVGLPHPQQLAALGAVLCLYPSAAGSELEGWSHAVHVACERAWDSEGLRESLQFLDGEGRCCWQLHLLPDTDFLAWEQAVAGRPEQAAKPAPGIGERLWQRLSRRLGGLGWRASVLRLHALSGQSGCAQRPLLAASPPRLSACGTEAACRIIRREGIAGDPRSDTAHGCDARLLAMARDPPPFDAGMCA